MNKVDYSNDDWSLIIKDQLDRGWPVIYRGYSESAGHAWNIDGYDESDYFHCNWGWGGSANGYYYLDPLSDNSISFIENQAALLNILPEGIEAPFSLFEFEVSDLLVDFSDLSSIVNSDDIESWFWDFGDGQISESQSPVYEYQDYGVYEVSLIVRSQYGLDSEPHIEMIELNPPIMGDVNQDQELNVMDVLYVLGCILDTNTLNENQFTLADINIDGLITVQDIILIVATILNR